MFVVSRQRMIRSTLVILLCAPLFAVVADAQGQGPKALEQTTPPPAKIISREERSQLNEAKDEKDRVKLTIVLAETHLTNAENHTAQQQYEGASTEAGMYWALIEDVLGFMKTIKRDDNRRRDLYKRLELSLRAQGPRLRTIRRSTPSEYAVWLKEIEEFARKSRTEALNSFYGQTVIREGNRQTAETKEPKKPSEKNY